MGTEYDFVVWSDHGQSLGATFAQICGTTLAECVRPLMADDAVRTLESANGDDWGPLNTLITSTLGRTVTAGGTGLEVGPDRGMGRPAAGERPDLVVVGGGNLGMVWFPGLDTRPTVEEVNARWPGLVPGLVLTEGIGMVLLATADDSAVAVGAQGLHLLATGEVTGIDPLAGYGP